MINIKNLTNNGICSNCGECCSDILPLSTQEIVEIDKYLKTHKVERHNLPLVDGRIDALCPFRNKFMKKCDIYEVRPYICKMFKCDTPPEKAEFTRDEISKTRKARSMTELFFKDDVIIKLAEKEVHLKIYKRGE